MFFYTSVLVSPDLSGPLQTAFELIIDLKTSRNQQDATALNEDTINWLKHPKNIKILFSIFTIFQEFKIVKSGGLFHTGLDWKYLFACGLRKAFVSHRAAYMAHS